MDGFFGLVCHQIVERSPQLGDQTFPLCYRCAGLHLGAFTAWTLLLFAAVARRRLAPPAPVAIVAALLLCPLLIDGWGNMLHLWNTPGPVRYATGLATALAIPVLLLFLLHGDVSTEPPSRRDIPWRMGFLGVLTFGGAFLALLTLPMAVATWPLLKVAATIGILSYAATVGIVLRSVFRNLRGQSAVFPRANPNVDS